MCQTLVTKKTTWFPLPYARGAGFVGAFTAPRAGLGPAPVPPFPRGAFIAAVPLFECTSINYCVRAYTNVTLIYELKRSKKQNRFLVLCFFYNTNVISSPDLLPLRT